ncbi:hypothetical protein N9174_02345 [bacterium]|nr:hypothetical protein [bacterium]
MKNKIFAIYFVLSLILLFAGNSASAGPRIEEAELLHYKPQSEALHYKLRIWSKSQAQGLFEPGPVEAAEDLMTLTQRVKKSASGLFDITHRVDGINWEAHGPTSGSAYKREEIIGNTGYIRVNLLGRVAEARGIPHISSRYFHRGSLDGPPLDIYRAMLMLYPQFPLKLLKKGDRWKTRDKIIIESAEAVPIRGIATLKYELDMTVARDVKYRLIDYVERNGRRTAHIGFEATFNTEGAVTTESSENYTEGDGECSGDLYFSFEKGLLLEFAMKSKINESKSQGRSVRHWFNPKKSIVTMLGGLRSTPIMWLTDQEVHFELIGEM